MSATILRADSGRLPLADASVDLIVTSPPYWALRSYTDGGEHYDGQIGSEPTPAAYIDSLIECTAEWVRVLKPGGSIWVNLGDKYSATSAGPAGSSSAVSETQKARNLLNGRRRIDSGVPEKSLIGLPWRYAIRCIDDLGLILRAEVIWSKPNGLPESVTDRVRRAHETWFHLTKSPRYYAAVDAVREPHLHPGVGMSPEDRRAEGRVGQRAQRGAREADRRSGDNSKLGSPLGKLPGSVRTVATQSLTVPAELGVDHFAAFPMEWPRWIITGWCPEGGTVLDPFGGTGTTALVADVVGRHGVSVDMSADYCRLAAWRTTDPSQRAAAMQVEKPPVERAGQLDLFAEKGAA